MTVQGPHLGTLCVIDRVPRVLTDEQLVAIKVLASNLMAHLDLRLSHKQIHQYIDDMGGDEFTVILSQMTDSKDAGRIADAIIQKLSEPFTSGETQVTISASVGITIYPADGADSAQLLKNADVAMYAAKRDGRGCYRYFTPSV